MALVAAQKGEIKHKYSWNYILNAIPTVDERARYNSMAILQTFHVSCLCILSFLHDASRHLV